MKKARLFLYLSFISTALIMSVNIRMVQYYESRFKKTLSQDKLDAPQKPRVCRDIFEIGLRCKNMSEITDVGIRIISRAKKKKRFLRSLYYEVLGYEAPHMVQKASPGLGDSGTNITILKTWRFQQAHGQFSHMPCRLREYGPDEVRECTNKRKEINGRMTHLLYIGDSRIRQHVEVMLDLLRDLDLRITTYKGDVISVEDFLGDKGMTHWNKYKHNFRVESLKAPELIIDFKWAALIDWGDKPKRAAETLPYHVKSVLPENEIYRIESSYNSIKNVQDNITTNMVQLNNNNINKRELSLDEEPHRLGSLHNRDPLKFSISRKLRAYHDAKHVDGSTRVGAVEILKRLVSTPDEHLPDIIFLNSGAWLLDENYLTVLEHIDFASVLVSSNLKPLLHKLAERTTIVWLAPDPLKEHIQHIFDIRGAYTHMTNAIQEWLLNSQALLQPPGILFWDSFLPIAYAGMQDCILLSSENFNMTLLPKYKRFEPLIAWHCLERIHIGLEVLSVAVQMTLNHVCNLHLDGGYCCSEI